MANWVTGPPPTAPTRCRWWMDRASAEGWWRSPRDKSYGLFEGGRHGLGCWLEMESGQLGDGPPHKVPTRVQVVDGSGNPLSGVVGISAGNDHTVYLKVDGTVWAVGYNYNGQLGDGYQTGRTNPVQVVDGSGNPLSGVVGIFAGSSHTVYLKGTARFWRWGEIITANWVTGPPPVEPTRYRWWMDRAIL